MEHVNVSKEEQLQFILDSAGLGTWDLDPINQSVSWDKRCRELYGISHTNDVTYTDVLNYIYPADRDMVHNQVQKAIDNRSGGYYEAKFRVIGVEDDVLRWLLCRGKAYFNSDGQCYRFSGTAQDVTEAELHNNETLVASQQLALAVESSDQGTFHIDLQTGHLTYNDALSIILTGKAQTGLSRQVFLDHIHPQDATIRTQAYKVAEKTGRLRYTARFIWHDGSIHWVKASGKYLNDTEGNPTFFAGVLQDVTQDVDVRTQQHKMLSLIENSIECIVIADNDGQLTFLNNAGRQLVGMPLNDDVTKWNSSDFYTPTELGYMRREVWTSLNRNGFWTGKIMLRHLQTSQPIPCHANMILLQDPVTGVSIGRAVTLRDLRQEQIVHEALRDSETRFSRLVMQAPVAIGIFQGENLVLETANDYMLDILASDRSIIDRPLLKAMPHLIGQPLAEMIEEAYHSNKITNGYEFEVLLHRENRLENCYFNFIFSPVPQPHNRKAVMVMGIEVTEQVKARQAIRDSELRFRNLVLDAPIATAIYTGRNFTISLANEAMIKLWGKDDSVINKPLSDALPELDGQPFLQLLHNVYDTGIAYHTSEQKANLFVDGQLKTFYFNFTYKPLFDKYGKVYAILNMAVDVSSLVAARDAQKQIEERLHTAIELAELGTWQFDPKTGLTTLSARMKQWFGIDDDAPSLEDDLMSIHTKDRNRVRRAIERALIPESDGDFDEEYMVTNRKTGEERMLHAKGKVIFDDKGQPLIMTGKAQDVTLQLATQRELERLVDVQTQELQNTMTDLERVNANLEQYAYVASHDLQEPLRKIHMFTDILQSKAGDELSPANRVYLDRISAAALRMSTLVKEILAFSKLRRREEEFVATDLNDIIENIREDLDVALTEKNITLTAETLPSASAIPIQMNQLFYNLIGNAIKFSKQAQDSFINITCRMLTSKEVLLNPQLNAAWPYCEIVVRDNGIGFDPNFAEQIFIMFRRLNTREAYPGTGIGLALCKKIMMNHHGDIFAQSSEGEGSSFHILLPLSRGEK